MAFRISGIGKLRCRLLLAGLSVWASGCAHQPGAFRLIAPGTLVPPDAKDLTLTRAVVRLASPAGKTARKAPCGASPHGLSIERPRFGAPRVVVTRQAIDSTTGPELFSWTVELEKQGCIPANEAFRLAENIVDALPLDLTKRNQLLQGRGDLKPVNSLRVVSPVLKPGASGSLAEIDSVSQGAKPGSVDVVVKANPAVIGYEIDWYDIAAQDGGPGYRIVPRSAEIHVGDDVEHPAAPSTSRFQFGPSARWYELYMMTKVSANDFDFVVFSARTSDELQGSVTAFQNDAAAFLKTADPASYNVLPHGSGINAYVRVRVNGVSVDLPRGNTIREIIGQANGDLRTVLPKLKVSKLHDGRLYPVTWDRSAEEILSLRVEGGEEIDW